MRAKALEQEKHIKQYSLQKFFETILNPFINLMQAINFGQKSTNPEVKSYVVGFTMYFEQILHEFKTFGLEMITPEVGQPFNPEFHEVVDKQKSVQKNLVIQLVAPGFQLYDHVLKPAKVIVGE